MSNKLTRKGLAFLATTALSLAGLVAAVPANAVIGSLSLNPAAGSTYESINQSGVTVATSLGGDSNEGALKWQITSANSNYTTGQILDLLDSSDLNLDVEVGYGSYANNSEDISYLEDTIDNLGFAWDVQGGAIVLTPYEPFGEYQNDDSEDGNESDTSLVTYDEYTYYVSIWSEDDTNLDDIKLSVRAFSDDNYNNEVTSGEARSSEAVVTLYDVRTVTSTTTVLSANVGEPLVTKTVLNKPKINTWFVSPYLAREGSVVAAHYSNNSTTLAGAWDRVDDYYPEWDSDFYNNQANIDAGIRQNFPLIAESDSNVSLFGETSVNYSSRAWFQDSDSSEDNEDFVKWLSPRSATTAVFAGGNAAVDDIYEFVTENDNLVQIDADEADLRTGTASAVVSGQIVDGMDDLLASNVRVRATFTVQNLVDEDSEITVTGVTGDAVEGEELVAYGRTDAKGVVSFTFANSGADELDSVYVLFEVLNANGVWVDGNGMDFEWADAYLDDFSVSDDATSAASVSLTYEAVDQFGKGIDAVGTDEDDVLQVTLTGLDDDENTLDKTALVPQTKSLSSGKATFTFANYAAVDSFVWVAGILHTANYDKDDLTTLGDEDGADVSGDSSYEVTQVWKNDATKAVESVENEYKNKVSYTEFRNGTYADDAFYAWLEDTGDNTEDSFGVYGGNDEDGERAVIYGSIETANGNGAAYQAVTVSASGLYFSGYNVAGDYAAANGSLTVETDADGNFEVDVYSHLENLTGKTITITSGGKSTTTKLITYMNPDIDNEDYWNGTEWVDGSVLTWNWDKMTGNMPSANTEYQITVTVKDVWGNILDGADLEVSPNGYADVGLSREDDVDDDDYVPVTTNASGKATFSFAKGPFYMNYDEDADDIDFLLAPGGNSGRIDLDLVYWNYDVEDNSYDFWTEGYSGEGIGYQDAQFRFGPQAIATEAAKKGVVKVQAGNVKGKTVRIFVSGKLVKTVVADKAIFKTKVKGVKAGDKRVTVKVGAKRMFSSFITVK